jgi:hypothetical protein
MQCEYYISIYFYNKDKEDDIIACHSDSQNSPYITICVDYKSKSSFELFYTPQDIYFIASIEKLILNTYNIIFPGVLTNMGKRDIHIGVEIFMDLNQPKNENPEISIGAFMYNDDRCDIIMYWDIY